MITQNTVIQYNSQWRNTVLQELYLEVDTTFQPITITLPEIISMGGFYNVKFYISDKTGNSSVNPITIVTQGSDLIDSGSLVTLSTNYGTVLVACAKSSWIALESSNIAPINPAIVLLTSGRIYMDVNTPQQIDSAYTNCIVTDVIIRNANAAIALTQQGSLTDNNGNLVAKIIFNNAGENGIIRPEDFLNKDVTFTAGKSVELYGLVQQKQTITPFFFQSPGLDAGVLAEINIYGYNL